MTLAINGGTPVRLTPLPYSRQVIEQDDIDAVTEALKSDYLTTGQRVADFEAAFAGRVGAKHAVAVSNGTAALHACMASIGIGETSQVIVPVMTFAATANAVRYEKGRVVFVDVRPDTLNIDVGKVQAAITPHTRAIVGVDYAGHPCELERLRLLAEENDLIFIEDAAHSLGAEYYFPQRAPAASQPIGSIAHLTTFSFHAVKAITTGEGGMVTTNSDVLATRLRRFRNHGITTDHRQRAEIGSWYYEMHELGYNYRLTDFQCALGSSQLKKLDRWLERRAEVAGYYFQSLAPCEEIEFPTVLESVKPAWHLFPIRLLLDRLTVGRDVIFRALRAENIEVNVHYIPVPAHPYYKLLGSCKRGAWPVAEAEYERLISLPLWAGMTSDDASDVVAAVYKVVGEYRKGKAE